MTETLQNILISLCKGTKQAFAYCLNPYAALLVAIYRNIIYFYLQVL